MNLSNVFKWNGDFKYFSEKYVENLFVKYNKYYKEMIKNICEIILILVIGHFCIGKPLSEQDFSQGE